MLGLAVLVVVLIAAGLAFVLTRPKEERAGAPNAVVSGPDELPSDQVTLGPNTVVVRGNGGKAIKSVAADGSTFTLDGSAEGIDKVKAGSIMIVTGVTVLKVTDVTASGGDVVVKTEAPAITDVITDGDIVWDKVTATGGTLHIWDPKPDDVKVTSKGDQPDGSTTTTAAGQAVDPTKPVIATPAAYKVAGQTSSGELGGFKYTYTKTPRDDGSAHYKIVATKDEDFKFLVTIEADVETLITGGEISVSGGKLSKLKLQSDKIAGKLSVAIDAGVGDSLEPVKTTVVRLPLSFDIPIVIYGIPFNLSISGAYLLEPAFTSKQSTMGGKVELSFGGPVGLSYENGTLTANGNIDAHKEGEPIETVQGTGVGATGFVFAAQFPKIQFGLGWGSSNAGPFIDEVLSLGFTIAPGVALLPCRQLNIVNTVSAGIGIKFLGVDLPDLGKKEISKKQATFYRPEVKGCQP